MALPALGYNQSDPTSAPQTQPPFPWPVAQGSHLARSSGLILRTPLYVRQSLGHLGSLPRTEEAALWPVGLDTHPSPQPPCVTLGESPSVSSTGMELCEGGDFVYHCIPSIQMARGLQYVLNKCLINE